MKNIPPKLVTPENLAGLIDLYELSMVASHFEQGHHGSACFDLFVRRLPPNRSYLVFAGLEQAIRALTSLSFSPGVIRYLRTMGLFSRAFLSYLRGFRFRGHVDAMPEGTVFFPNEPVLRVTGNLIEAQLVETILLNIVTHQSLIATKATRVVHAAQGRPVVEFGLRRSHGTDAGLQGARAAYVAGCVGSSNVLAGQLYGIPTLGTMAHAYVQAFRSELEAFRAFTESFPDGTTLLIDTYDPLQGARHAAQVARELAARGGKLGAVRLDSGDLVRLSRKVRAILDRQGLRAVKIFASGNLSEFGIAEMCRRRAPIDAFGVGTEMSVSQDAPSLDSVYKLSEVEIDGKLVSRMKFSTGKATFPGRKQIYRREKHGRYIGDVLGLEGEAIQGSPLLRPVLHAGKLLQRLPSLETIRRHAAEEQRRLPISLLRLHKVGRYPVRLSAGLQREIRRFRKSFS
ncbi:MAG: nicotinate phosphoribosyltransferase [Nitrospirae bacterium]|nr:nicotinate phosphoribosyltransferase [Nitrospirota bacterium]